MGDGDLRTTLVIGARLLCGWACVAVALLDLVTGFETGPYLVFHLVLLAGGLLLLQRPPNLYAYAVVTALAVLSTVVAALPSTEQVCCLRGLAVRHGYPLSLIGWNPRESVHFAPAHAAADLAFWFLSWTIVAFVAVKLRPRAGSHPADSPGQSGLFGFFVRRSVRRPLPHPLPGGTSEAAGSDTSASSSTDAPMAHDESVGGLP